MADTELANLTEDTAPAATDIVYVVTDPSGTQADRKVQIGNLGAVRKSSFPVVLQYAISDETTAITTGTGKLTARAPFAFTLTEVRVSLNSATTTGTFTVDVNESGTTVLSTKVTVDATEKTSTTATTAAVISDSAIADDAELTFDVDDAGDGTATGAKVTLIGTRNVS